jgi:hypothetical protein
MVEDAHVAYVPLHHSALKPSAHARRPYTDLRHSARKPPASARQRRLRTSPLQRHASPSSPMWQRLWPRPRARN